MGGWGRLVKERKRRGHKNQITGYFGYGILEGKGKEKGAES